ncbi:hypothetical protein ACQKMV_07970 [Lysinibacillus sp. NPDC094403]|uniref:hypothetical protein n=1 Tax=Lysinibacillus sp. NPDC094403 TaxID=3390581 RepID=UPI003D02CC85
MVVNQIKNNRRFQRKNNYIRKEKILINKIIEMMSSGDLYDDYYFDELEYDKFLNKSLNIDFKTDFKWEIDGGTGEIRLNSINNLEILYFLEEFLGNSSSLVWMVHDASLELLLRKIEGLNEKDIIEPTAYIKESTLDYLISSLENIGDCSHEDIEYLQKNTIHIQKEFPEILSVFNLYLVHRCVRNKNINVKKFDEAKKNFIKVVESKSYKERCRIALDFRKEYTYFLKIADEINLLKMNEGNINFEKDDLSTMLKCYNASLNLYALNKYSRLVDFVYLEKSLSKLAKLLKRSKKNRLFNFDFLLSFQLGHLMKINGLGIKRYLIYEERKLNIFKNPLKEVEIYNQIFEAMVQSLECFIIQSEKLELVNIAKQVDDFKIIRKLKLFDPYFNIVDEEINMDCKYQIKMKKHYDYIEKINKDSDFLMCKVGRYMKMYEEIDL